MTWISQQSQIWRLCKPGTCRNSNKPAWSTLHSQLLLQVQLSLNVRRVQPESSRFTYSTTFCQHLQHRHAGYATLHEAQLVVRGHACLVMSQTYAMGQPLSPALCLSVTDTHILQQASSSRAQCICNEMAQEASHSCISTPLFVYSLLHVLHAICLCKACFPEATSVMLFCHCH